MSAEPSLEHPLKAETLGPSVGSSLDASMVMTDTNEDWKSCFEKSEGEVIVSYSYFDLVNKPFISLLKFFNFQNADIYIGLDSFDDLLPHSSGIGYNHSSSVLLLLNFPTYFCQLESL